MPREPARQFRELIARVSRHAWTSSSPLYAAKRKRLAVACRTNLRPLSIALAPRHLPLPHFSFFPAPPPVAAVLLVAAGFHVAILITGRRRCDPETATGGLHWAQCRTPARSPRRGHSTVLARSTTLVALPGPTVVPPRRSCIRGELHMHILWDTTFPS